MMSLPEPFHLFNLIEINIFFLCQFRFNMSTQTYTFPVQESSNILTENLIQKKLSFFKRTPGETITLYDSFHGFRILGFNLITSFILALIMNLYFAIDTFNLKKRSFLSIRLENLDKYSSIKPSLIRENFEKNWERIDTENTEKLRLYQLIAMYHSERLDTLIIHSFLMFFLWWIAADQKGFVSKERAMQFFEGNLFERIETARKMNYPHLPNKIKIRVRSLPK